MGQIVFGAGALFQKDATAGATAPQSRKIATLQEVTIDISEDEAELYGQSKFPIDVKPTKGKVDGKIKVASYEPSLASAAMAGGTTSTGYTSMVDCEAHIIPATPGPYTVVVTHAADYGEDYGVMDQSTLRPYVRVASNPATGQYSVNEATGTYTFAAADQGKAIYISHTRDITASGQSVTVTNVQMGTSTIYKLFGWNEFDGLRFGYEFPTVRVSGMNLGMKADSHMQPEHKFKAFAAPGAVVYRLFLA